ncbi:MAG: hypothetical protein ACP5SH_22620 [Syntrophobacteraceae bacterium]
MTQHALFFLLVLDEDIKTRILSMLQKHKNFRARIVFPDELSADPQRELDSIILIDCSSVLTYGVTIISRLKFCCPDSKLVLLCSQDNRHLVGRVMELGAYGCILEPYEEWELLAMVRLILSGRRIE